MIASLAPDLRRPVRSTFDREGRMIYVFGDRELDTDTFELRRAGAPVNVEPQVFDVLSLLVAHRERVVTKEELLDSVWGDRFVSESALTSRIKDARRAVGDDGHRQEVIRTVHGRGYRFVAPVDEHPGSTTTTAAARPAAPPLHRDETASRPRTSYARSGTYSIAYQTLGDGPGDLLFVPGFVSNVELQWEFPPMASFFERLAESSRLILFDKRGTGLSDRVPVTEIPALEERMDDLRAVLDAAGSERATLFGISEGGPLALLFAATYPERVERLVLCNSYADRFREDIPALARAARRLWGTGASFRTLAPSWRDPAAHSFLARYERNSATPDTAAHLIELCGHIDVRPVLHTIIAPALILHRRDDTIFPLTKAHELAEGIPGARLQVLEGSDHLVFADHGPVLDAVEEFVTGAPVAPTPDRVLTTILFADLVGSTELAERIGDAAWRQLLSRFYATVRRELANFRGEEIATTGDGFLATFDGPARAVRCGQSVQDAVDELGLPLRVGAHTAEVERLGDDIAGLGVHVASRVTAAADPGQVWVTRTVRDLVAGSGLVFEPLGAHEFKGVTEPWELYAACR
jgi:pimeloyl-ACP methyl ester carboxylesterase/DNA-binding winged helix-turn-helix (wHTH) protein